MLYLKAALPLALATFQLCSAIPIAPDQVVLELSRDTPYISSLLADITASDLTNAQVAYENLQSYLDDFGFYLGAIEDATCVEEGPDESTNAATTQSAVLSLINSITSSLAALSSSIESNNTAAAHEAYSNAQSDLERTYDFIFNSTTSSPTTPTTPGATTPASVYASIQSAQVALNNLAFDLVKSDYSTATSDFYAISKQINAEIAPAANCSFITMNPATCTTAISCVQFVQLGLNRVAGDLLASASTSQNCLEVGADLGGALKYISMGPSAA